MIRQLPRRVSEKRPFLHHALTYLQTQVWFQKNLADLVKTHQIDLVHFHTRFRGQRFYQSVAKLPVPVLADLRDKMSDPAALAKCSQHLLCCALGVARFATEGGYPSARMSYVPITFAPSAPQPPEAIAATRTQFGLEKRAYLLYLGDITPNKGIYELLPAYAQWQKQVSQVDLVLAGMNREGPTFTRRVAQMPGVHYLGHISHTHALALMQAAEMVLLPSRSEGLPSVILEAVGLGKKVVCPPHIPEFETYLPDFVLPEVSTEAIFQTIQKVWHSPITPSYPLEIHAVPGVVSQIVSLYQQLVKKG
ncbi:MAG: glycosyltransferase family 4 protein [Chloroflexota bacterium]